MSPAAKDIDGYLAAPPKDQRSALEQLRKTIKAAAPQAAESISYAIPTFEYKGKPLIYFRGREEPLRDLRGHKHRGAQGRAQGLRHREGDDPLLAR
jgi:Domain of unknown function (DU1801)